MQFVQFYACDAAGITAPGARVTVHPKDAAALAAIYDAAGARLPNPLTAGADGLYGFAAANGDYDVVVSIGAVQASQRLYLFDPADGLAAPAAPPVVGDGDLTLARVRDATNRQFDSALALIDQLTNRAVDVSDAALAAALAKFGTDGEDLNAQSIAQLVARVREIDDRISSMFRGLPPGPYVLEIETKTNTSIETLNVIGLVTPNGLGFVFNDSSVTFSDGVTLAAYRAGVNVQAAGIIASVTNEQLARQQGDSANASSIVAVNTQVGNNTAAILSVSKASSDGLSSEAQSRLALAAVVNGNASTVNQNLIALSTADSTEATARLALDSRFQGFQSSASTQLVTLASNDQSFSASLVNLNSDYGSFKSSAGTQLTTLANNDVAQSLATTNLSSDYSGFKSSASTQLVTLSNSSQSLSNSIVSLSSDYGAFKSSASSQLSALANNDMSLASSITNLSSDYSGFKGSASQQLVTLSNGAGSMAASIQTLTAQAGSLQSAVNINANAIAQVQGRTVAFFQVATTAPGGQAVLSLYADNYGSNVMLAAGRIYFGQYMYFEDSSRTLQTRYNGQCKVSGPGFGSSGQFIEWWGPDVPLGAMTESNALMYMRTDGSAFSAGGVTAGTSQASGFASSYGNPPGSVQTSQALTVRGGAVKIDVSLVTGFVVQVGGASQAAPVPTVTVGITVEASVNGGGWTGVSPEYRATSTLSQWDYDGESKVNTYQGLLNLSFSYPDSRANSSVTYRARISTQATTFGSLTGNGADLSIIATNNRG